MNGPCEICGAPGFYLNDDDSTTTGYDYLCDDDYNEQMEIAVNDINELGFFDEMVDLGGEA